MRTLLLYLIPACLLYGPAAALAAADNNNSPEPHEEDHEGHVHAPGHLHNDLEEVVVRATPLDQNVMEMAQSATVLKDAMLQREIANNIGETLARLPGLSNASYGQNVGRPVIRGMQGQRVGVLSNNMASGDASAGSQDHAVSSEPFLADQVEVLRGPSTLLYGSGAIGGVVNMVTHTIPQELPQEPFSGRAIMQIDSASDLGFAGARLGFGGDSYAFHANGFIRRSDDYEIPGEAELYPEEDHDDHDGHEHEEHDGHEEHDEHEEMHGVLENSFLDNEGGSIGGAWFGDNWQGGISLTTYHSEYGIPGHNHHHHEDDEHHDEGAHEEDGHDEHEHEEEETVFSDLESDRWDAELIGRNPFGGFEQLLIKAAGIDYTHTEFEGDEPGTVFESETFDSRLELRHEPWGASEGAFGIQYTEVDFLAFGEEAFVPDTDTTTAALFWVENIEFDSWSLEAGLRYEDVDLDVLEHIEHHDHDEHEGHEEDDHDDQDIDNFGFKPFSVSLGAVWHVTDDNHLSFNLSRAERAPTAQELLSNGPHIATQAFEIGDPHLDMESNLHAEVGYRMHGGKLTGNIVLYVDKFDDYIYQEFTGEEEHGLPVMHWSQQDADFTGAEVELLYDIGHFDSGHWQASAFYDRVRAELNNGENVPLMPPSRIGLGLDWHFERWTASASWIHASDHDRVADFETKTPGYDLVNLDASWLIMQSGNTDLELFLKGHNLLDEEIRNSTSTLKDRAPQIGRNFIIGLRAHF
jgi:iron complex outermembrane receptor protein